MFFCFMLENSEKLYGEWRRGEGIEILILDGGWVIGVVDYDFSV